MLPDPHGFSVDPLTDILCAGARNLIQQAVEAELSMLLATHSKSHAYEIVAMVPRRFASHRRSCRPICAMPNLSKICSTRDFQEALAALLGSNAASLSSTTISRLKADWWDYYDRWQRRDLSTRRFAYIWADGVYFRPRMAKEKQCVLVLLGADEWGHERTALLRASSPPFGIKPAKPKAA
jgi:putative transposase